MDLADGEYMAAKAKARAGGKPNAVTLDRINRRFGLKKRQLHNYRANHYSRK